MPAKKRTVRSVMHTALPLITSTSTSSSGSNPSVTSAGGILPTVPPDIDIPSVPSGFVPVSLKMYRGSFPRVGEIAALPGAIIELTNNTSYETVFGPAAPEASQLVSDFTYASQWTALRVAIEAYLEYVRSNEAITWRSSLIGLEKLNAIFQVVATQNPVLIAGFPELHKLLDVRKVIARSGAASRVRNAKAKAAEAKANAAAAASSSATAGGATPGTGGATH
jgi:hypothetical protein